MKRLGFSLLFVFYAGTILSMGTPPSIPILIIANRTGTIDTSCITHATLVQDKTCLAEISYALQGHKGIRSLICATGLIAYQNDTFLRRITRMNIKETHSASLALLAFAIKDLKELHEKQNKTGIQNHTLHIDAIVNPGSFESTAFEFFGFKKVSNWFANGFEQHIYLLDSSSVGQERTSLCQHYLNSVSSVALENKQAQDEEILPESDAHDAAAIKNTSINIQHLLDEQGKRTRGNRQKKSHPSHLPTSKPGFDPSKLGTPIPAAATAPVHAAFPCLIRTAPTESSSESSLDEMHAVKTSDALTPRNAKLSALAKLRAKSGKPQKLSRTELVAMVPKTGLYPIRGISKKKDR